MAGTGWGSVSLLQGLDTSKYNVVVISPRDHFLFTPLLPSCVTGLLEGRSLTEPIRNILSQKSGSIKFCKASVSKIDYQNRLVYLNDSELGSNSKGEDVLSFDLLVIGIGAENATFGMSLSSFTLISGIKKQYLTGIGRSSGRQGARLFSKGSQ